jgi:hypothetical protein
LLLGPPSAQINIVANAAMHTRLPRWVRFGRARSTPARKLYPQNLPRRPATETKPKSTAAAANTASVYFVADSLKRRAAQGGKRA